MKNRPFIICHMMTSVDGRIDCDMTEQLGDDNAYYASLASLMCPTQLMGRQTMMTHYTDGTPFTAEDRTPVGCETIHATETQNGYAVVVDTHGSLNISSPTVDDKPLLVVMSESAPAAYADNLTQKGVCWIASGKNAIDLPRVMEILANDLGVERLVVVGGGNINGSMLKEGLLDEVSLIVGAGIDGRKGMTAVFDGLSHDDWRLTRLRLQGVMRVGTESVWLRYDVERTKPSRKR